MASKSIAMKSKTNIEALHRIQRVKAPPMLLSHIHARIANRKDDKIAPAWVFSLAAAIALLVMFNVLSFRQNTGQLTNGITTEMATDMHLIQSNQLYHE